MIQAFYTGLSGMTTFSKGLDVISNNIANMNTYGYRGRDLVFQSMLGSDGYGIGPNVTGQSIRHEAGTIDRTGQDMDMALSGNGYFILQDDDENLFYTRAGQFVFDEDDVVIDKATGFKVMGLDESGNLSTIDVSHLSLYPASRTTQLDISGTLDVHIKDEADVTSRDTSSSHESKVTVFNSLGQEINLTLKYSRIESLTSTPQDTVYTNNWTLEILDANENQVLAPQTLSFNPAGYLEVPLETITFTIPEDNTAPDGANMEISLNFGEFPTTLSTSDRQGGSDALVRTADGNAASSWLSRTVNDKGEIIIRYNNNEEQMAMRVAIASFTNEDSVNAITGNLFSAAPESQIRFGGSGDEGMGLILSKSLERSNVDLATEFGYMLTIQRGYQSSSRVLSTVNSLYDTMLENLR